MNITIKTRNIYDYALSLTANAGKNHPEYTTIAITEDNYPMLDVYLSSAVSYAEGELRRILSGSNGFDLKVTEEKLTIQIKDSSIRDKSVIPLTETGIRLFLAYYITAEWLRVTPLASLSEVYANIAVTHLQNSVSALLQKSLHITPDEDYGPRKNDNIMARCGNRIIEGEVLTIRSEDGRRIPAKTVTGELLVSN